MLYLKTLFDVADNTGARKASMIGVLNAKGRMWAQLGDIIRVNIKESAPDAAVKKVKKPGELLFVHVRPLNDQMEQRFGLIPMLWLLLMMLEIPRGRVFSVLLLVSCEI